MIKFIFGVLVAYVVIRIARVFIDPMFETSKPKAAPRPNVTSNPNQHKQNTAPSGLGEYVEYEEVK